MELNTIDVFLRDGVAQVGKVQWNLYSTTVYCRKILTFDTRDSSTSHWRRVSPVLARSDPQPQQLSSSTTSCPVKP